VFPELTEAPVILQNLSDVDVREGQTARFECIIRSTPAPQITWYVTVTDGLR